MSATPKSVAGSDMTCILLEVTGFIFSQGSGSTRYSLAVSFTAGKIAFPYRLQLLKYV
jgi:hypothetical protein